MVIESGRAEYCVHTNCLVSIYGEEMEKSCYVQQIWGAGEMAKLYILASLLLGQAARIDLPSGYRGSHSIFALGQSLNRSTKITYYLVWA